MESELLVELLGGYPEVGTVLGYSAEAACGDFSPTLFAFFLGELAGEAEVLNALGGEAGAEGALSGVVGHLITLVGSPSAFHHVAQHPELVDNDSLFLDYERHVLNVDGEVVGASGNLEGLIALSGKSELLTQLLVGNQEVAFAYGTEAVVSNQVPTCLVVGFGKHLGEAEVRIAVEVDSLHFCGIGDTIAGGHLLAYGRIPITGHVA